MKAIRMASAAIALTILPLAVFADEITEPTEVGLSTMPPGEYTLTEKKTSKTYSLMVTKKGSMIMGPPGAAGSAATVAAATAAAAVPAAAVGTPAAAAMAGVTKPASGLSA